MLNQVVPIIQRLEGLSYEYLNCETVQLTGTLNLVFSNCYLSSTFVINVGDTSILTFAVPT